MSQPLTGVFSTCSPNRPNPIGLHRAHIVARNGLRIEVDALEAIDGTPVVDIKPPSTGTHDALHAAVLYGGLPARTVRPGRDGDPSRAEFPAQLIGLRRHGSRTEARRTPCARSSRPLYRQPECPFDIVVDSICRIRSRVTP